MNKYLISVDIEGITGVSSRDFANKDGKYHALACKYMASDVNAVVNGILSADPEAYILVRDAHDYDATNLNLADLHPQATLIQGWKPILNMLDGLDETFEGVFLVGYHAGGQNNQAVLGHTMSSIVHYVKVNGQLVNETGLAALYASHYGVPIAFVSGDDFAIKEAKSQLGKIEGVVVKKSLSRRSTASLSLAKASKLLEEGAKKAVTRLQQNSFSIYKAQNPVTLEVAFYNSGFRPSVFQSLSEILSFDKKYKFDLKKFKVTFSSNDILEAGQRLNMLLCLIYGL